MGSELFFIVVFVLAHVPEFCTPPLQMEGTTKGRTLVSGMPREWGWQGSPSGESRILGSWIPPPWNRSGLKPLFLILASYPVKVKFRITFFKQV